MADRDELTEFLRTALRDAGGRYEQLRRSAGLEEARGAYESARNAAGLPEDDAGRARIVCRRYAERRAVRLDEEFRPACYEAGQPDCEGCLEDVREGRVETW